MTDLDPAAIMAAHAPIADGPFKGWCAACPTSQTRRPCLPYQLAQRVGALIRLMDDLTKQNAELQADRNAWRKIATDKDDVIARAEFAERQNADLQAAVKDAEERTHRVRVESELLNQRVMASWATLDKVAEVVNRYAITDEDGPGLEYTEPEDVWRLFRDLRAAGVPRIADRSDK